MKASVQWIGHSIGLVRVHPAGGYGDPWTWACCIVVETGIATVYIAKLAPTFPEARAIRDLFKQLGIHTATWERRDEESVVKEYKV